jgi:phage terminase large subunit
MRAYKDGVRVIGNKGSARSSKTVSIIQGIDLIVVGSARHRKISICSQSFPHLRDGAIYEYKKHQMRESVSRTQNKSEHEFHVNKSIINYFSVDDPAKAIGPGRDILYCNEVNKGFNLQMFIDLKQRTEECVWMDWNPSSPFFIHDQEDGNEAIINDSRTRIIHSTWLDNIENLTKAQIQDFIDAKRKSKVSDFWNYWWKVYGLGEDALLMEERIMPMLKRCKKVPDDAIEIPSALDFGFFPHPTSFLRMWIKKGELFDKLYIKQVIYDTKLSIDSKKGNNLTDALIAKGVNPKHKIIAECADPRAINDMRSAGFNIEAVVKTSVENGIRLFHDYEIHVVDGSEATYKELDGYKYKRNKKGIILGVPEPGQPDHSIDGARYVLSSRNQRWSIK